MYTSLIIAWAVCFFQLSAFKVISVNDLSSAFIAQLQQNGDFLSITRQYEWTLPCERFQFDVTHQASNTQSRVTVIDTGIILFEPKNHYSTNSTKDIVLSSGIHGNETAPIEICSELISQLILGKLPLAERVLFIFGNPASMNIGQRFVEENMNRLFSGGHSIDQGQGAGLINKERKRALLLENTVADFFQQGEQISSKPRTRYHYDLHTAIRGSKCDKFAVYPFLHGKKHSKSQLSFLLACGVNTILLSNAPTTTFSYFSSHQFDAHAFTIELGKVRAFGENDMSQFTEIKHTLTGLVSGQKIAMKAFQASDFQLFEISQVINRQHQNFSFTFDENVENFTTFAKDHVLAIDGDHEIKTQVDGEGIIFPNVNVAIGQRALLTVVPTELTVEPTELKN